MTYPSQNIKAITEFIFIGEPGNGRGGEDWKVLWGWEYECVLK